MSHVKFKKCPCCEKKLHYRMGMSSTIIMVIFKDSWLMFSGSMDTVYDGIPISTCHHILYIFPIMLYIIYLLHHIYIFFIVCFTSYFMFSIAVLPHSPEVVNYHLLLRRETRIPGVAPFSFQIGIWDLFVHRGQKFYTPTDFGKLWTTP